MPVDDTVETTAGTALEIDVLANDRGHGLTIASTGAGSRGSVSILQGRKRVTYHPETGFVGDDRFHYSVVNADGVEGESEATVIVKVKTVPPSCDDRDRHDIISGFGLVTLRVINRCRIGQKLRIEHDGRTCTRLFDAGGNAVFRTARGRDGTLSYHGVAGEEIRLDIPGDDSRAVFDHIIRVTIRWQDPVDLDLHVLEPGFTRGGRGHIWAGRRNQNGQMGIGAMDVASDGTVDDCFEESYLVKRKDVMKGSVLRAEVDFATRSRSQTTDVCGSGRLAEPRYVVIAPNRRRQLDVTNYSFERLRCDLSTSQRAPQNLAIDITN